jgi:hypothetical protein
MGERIGHWALQQLLDRGVQRAAGGQKGIEALQRLEEALLLFGPDARLRGLPALLSDGRAQRPLEQVAHVSQNLHRHPPGAGKSGKVIGRAFQCPCGPVGNGGKRVTQQFAFLIHRGTIAQTVRL